MPAAFPLYTVEDLAHFPEDGNRYELLDGILLVTPQATPPHQVVATRIAHYVMRALGDEAMVTCAGAVIYGEHTELQPDVLVNPQQPFVKEWRDITEHWLAVEVYSPSSRIYDREFKTPEYLRRGVAAVWLVDVTKRCVEVFAAEGPPVMERSAIRWRPPELAIELEIDLAELFRGLNLQA